MSKTWRDLDLKGISVRQEGSIAVVTLDRPQARNSFNFELAKSLTDVYPVLDSDDSVKVVVLTGEPNPGKAFCAGADLSVGDFSQSASWNASAEALPHTEHRDEGGQCVLAAFRVRKPVRCRRLRKLTHSDDRGYHGTRRGSRHHYDAAV